MSQAEHNRRVAVVDVGSNSVRLLVADISAGQALVVYAEKITSRLLSGMCGDLLDLASVERTIGAIRELTARARSLGAEDIAAFGTSAMRDGSNSFLLTDASRKLGVPMDILSGAREAEIAYRGAAPEGRCGVLDIGGGSTEALAGENGRVLCARSVRVGAVRLYEEMAGELNERVMLDRAQAALLPAWECVRRDRVDRLVGVGGTITSLAAMSLALTAYDSAAIEGLFLSAQRVIDWHGALCRMSVAKRKTIAGLSPERADIIPFGAAILRAWLTISGAPGLFVTDRDNLLGYIREIFIRK